jgi:hypothetical protein
MFHKFADKSKRPYRQSAGRLGWARSSSNFALEIKESRLLEIHPTALVHLNTSFNAQLLVSHSSPNYGQISASYRLRIQAIGCIRGCARRWHSFGRKRSQDVFLHAQTNSALGGFRFLTCGRGEYTAETGAADERYESPGTERREKDA